MDDLISYLSSWDSVWVAWIAGGLALAFVSLLAYDSYRRKQRRGRISSRAGQPRGANPIQNLRSAIRTMDAEFTRRRRQRARERDLRR